MPDNIIAFKPRDPNEMPLEIDRWGLKFGEHKHGRLLISLEKGIVVCRLCEKEVSAWQALVIVADTFAMIRSKAEKIENWEKQQRDKYAAAEKRRQERANGGGNVP